LRLAAVRDLTARATDVARALDRATLAAEDAQTGSSGEKAKRGRARSKGFAATGAGTVTPSAAGPTHDESSNEDGDPIEEPGAGKTAVPAAERRRAATIVVGLWRELARDLLLVALGEERQVRDPGLLDDLRVAAATLGVDGGSVPGSERAAASEPAPDPADGPARDPGAGLGGFLGRLDAAGELLEANVRPELVLDTLLLRWPRAAR
jgi:hypothetical protein